jgi:predicted Zn-ribbon and HTH transcriptional regulator
MGLREEIIRVLEEANQPLSDSEINERMEGEREDQAM